MHLFRPVLDQLDLGRAVDPLGRGGALAHHPIPISTCLPTPFPLCCPVRTPHKTFLLAAKLVLVVHSSTTGRAQLSIVPQPIVGRERLASGLSAVDAKNAGNHVRTGPSRQCP